MISKKVDRHKAGVYKITNLINNKSYIGSSIEVYNRKHTHINKLKNKNHSCKHLEYAYHKYGEDNFLFEVLEYCNDITEKEQYYINLLKPEYNKRKVAQNNKGLLVSQKTRDKISTTLKDNYINGQEPYKQQHKWEIVEQYDLEGNYIKDFKNKREAEKSIKCSKGQIARAVRTSGRYFKNFQWKIKGSSKVIEKIENKSAVAKKIKVTNIVLNKYEIFPSLAVACLKLNISRSSINKVIARKGTYLGKYKFEYTEVQYKLDELLEKPEVVNQQPSLDSNIFEGSTTNSRILSTVVEDSNANTSIQLKQEQLGLF